MKEKRIIQSSIVQEVRSWPTEKGYEGDTNGNTTHWQNWAGEKEDGLQEEGIENKKENEKRKHKRNERIIKNARHKPVSFRMIIVMH